MIFVNSTYFGLAVSNANAVAPSNDRKVRYNDTPFIDFSQSRYSISRRNVFIEKSAWSLETGRPS